MSAIGERVAVLPPSHFQWSAILGGAAIAAGISLTLNAFGAGIGLSLISSAPTWRDTSATLALIGGVFLLMVAVISFAAGGYVAGRMRAPLSVASAEREFRDGMHGLAAWGVAVILAGILALGAAAIAKSTVAPSVQATPAETIIATELDDLFRTGKVVDDMAYRRAEAARILLKSSSHNGIPNSDRNYLTTLTSIVTGTPDPEAQARVNQAIAESEQALHRARVAAVIQAFFVAAALLVGAVIAWYAATEGGKDREEGVFHFWDWSRRRL
jgi:hypothetical protein